VVMLRALEVPQADSGRRSHREHVYDPAASRLLHHGTTMSDKKSTDKKATEEFDEELPEGPGDDEFDPDDVGDDDDSGDPKGADEDNEDDGNDEAGPKPTAVSEDDEDEPDPSDVEADLAGILRDRIAAGDDEDEEEEGEVALVPASGDVEGRRESEIHCPNCFLLVTTDTVTDTGECPHCGGPIP